MNRRPVAEAEAVISRPVCPSCGCRDVVTTSKTVDASTYWRCGACGEVWNAERQREALRRTYRNPFER